MHLFIYFIINTKKETFKLLLESLLFSLLTHFAFIFSLFGVFRLIASKAKKPTFFRFKARTKIPTFSLVFALSEYERRLVIGKKKVKINKLFKK
jgi:hypothetical protein